MKKGLYVAFGIALMLHGAGQIWAAGSQSFRKAQYYRVAGTKTQKIKGTLQLDSRNRQVRFIDKKSEEPILVIDYQAIGKIVYEKSSKPRYAAAVFISPLFLLSRSKKHWATLEYGDAEDPEKAVIRLDKKNFHQALQALESETGVEVEYSVKVD